MSLLGAMLLAVLTWLFAGAVVLGMGLAAWRALGLEGDTEHEPRHTPHVGGDSAVPLLPPASVAGRVWRAWWLGLVVLIGWLMAWHLALPIGWWCVLATALFGAAGVWWHRSALSMAWSEVVTHPGHLRWLLAWGGVGLWLANRGAGNAVSAVNGLWWEPAIAWADRYAAVPGVGNVHPVQGLNQGWTLVAAWFSAGPWSDRPGQLVSGWVLWMLSAAGLWGVKALLDSLHARPQQRGQHLTAGRRDQRVSPTAIYHAALLVPVVVLTLGVSAAEGWPSVASLCLLLVATASVFSAVGPEELHRGRRIDALALTVVLAVGAAAADVGSAPAVLALIAVTAWRVLGHERAWVEGARPTRSVGVMHEHLPGLAPRSGTVSAVALVSASLFLLWAAQNAVTTGYPLHPWTGFSLPVDWAVPSRGVAWGRWLPRPEAPVLATGALGAVWLPTLAGLAGLMAWLARGGDEGRWKGATPVAGALAVGVLGWALVSGRGLSATGPAWALAALTLALNARTLNKRGRPVPGPSGRTLLGTLGGAAALAGVVHVAFGGGATLWPVRLVGPEGSGVAVVTTVRASNAGQPSPTWSGMPVRWPWSAGAGFAEVRLPGSSVWVSRWGVEIAVTMDWTDDRDEQSEQLASVAPEPPPWMRAVEPGGTSVSPDVSDATTPPSVQLPWALEPPGAVQPPSEHLRYRRYHRDGTPDVGAGFVIDRRGAKTERPGTRGVIRQAERPAPANGVFRDNEG